MSARKLFTASCTTCYSQRLEGVGIRAAERWCTQHEASHGHSCGIVPYRGVVVVVEDDCYFLDGQQIDLPAFLGDNDDDGIAASIGALDPGQFLVLGGGAAAVRVVSRATRVTPEDAARILGSLRLAGDGN